VRGLSHNDKVMEYATGSAVIIPCSFRRAGAARNDIKVWRRRFLFLLKVELGRSGGWGDEPTAVLSRSGRRQTDPVARAAPAPSPHPARSPPQTEIAKKKSAPAAISF
jgi:hypothetical protein